jgi:hypothetical protein
MNDLVVQTEERKILWHALRERANQEETYDLDELAEVDLEPTILAALLGIDCYPAKD